MRVLSSRCLPVIGVVMADQPLPPRKVFVMGVPGLQAVHSSEMELGCSRLLGGLPAEADGVRC